jgi:hypothetical protein
MTAPIPPSALLEIAKTKTQGEHEQEREHEHGILDEIPTSLETPPYSAMSGRLSTEGSISSLPTPSIETVSELGSQLSTADSPQSPTYSPSQTTIIELASISATSSALPESFGLSISSKGRWIAAYSSAALYIFLSQRLPVFEGSCRGFRLRRKPVYVAITDVGKFAVLTSAHKIDVYQCGDGAGESLHGENEKLQTILLNNEAKTLAFSVSGKLVAAGSEHGIEIISLGVQSGSDRRQINCGSVESIAFSEDEKSLIATAPARKSRISTLISLGANLEDAFLEDEEVEEQPVEKLWISQLLFPERLEVRQCVFLPDPNNGQNCEMLAYSSGRFGLFDTVMKQFTGKQLGIPEDVQLSRSERYEDALPGVSSNGINIAAAVRFKDHSEVWTYRLPPGWRDDMDSSEEQPSTQNLPPLQRLELPRKAETTPNDSISCLQWVQLPSGPVDRLIALVSTVALAMPEDMPTGVTAANGKIVLFDFNQLIDMHPEENATKVTISLDDFPLTEDLASEEVDIEQEVDLVRRRTQVQRRREPAALSTRDLRLRRSLSSSSRNSVGGYGSLPAEIESLSSRPRRRRSFSSMSDMSEDIDIGIPMVAPDEPYSNSAPRSQFTLNRAATVLQNAPSARRHLRAAPSRPLEYRRADGLRQIPHESDADNWVPPPPPYSANPDNVTSLPITAIPGAATAVLQGRNGQRNPTSSRDSRQPAPQSSRSSRRTNPIRNTLTRSQNQRSQPLPMPAPVNPAPRSRPVIVPPVPSLPRMALPTTPLSPTNPPMSQMSQMSQLISRRPITGSSSLTPYQHSMPAPGSLHSPLTFPLTRPRSPNNSHLMPQHMRSASGSVTAPVSPVNPAGQEIPLQRNAGYATSSPTAPTPEQIANLHRREASGGSRPSLSSRPASSADFGRPQQPSTPDRGPSRPSPRQSDTFGSANSYSPPNPPQAACRISTFGQLEPEFIQPDTRPETPTGASRRWWRPGSSAQNRRDSHLPYRDSSLPLPARSRLNPPSANHRLKDPKESKGSSGFRCIVM